MHEIRIGTLDLCCEHGLCSAPLFCRSSPHPYITALENRVDCWPALLLEIDDFIQQAADRLAWLQQRPCTLHPITPSFTTWISKPSVKSTPCQITHHTTVSCYYAALTNTHTTSRTVWIIFFTRFESKEVSFSHMFEWYRPLKEDWYICPFQKCLLTYYVYIYCRNEPAYITMLAPFLRYLYCEPQRQPQHALLRHSLIRVLLPIHPGAGSVLQKKDQEQTSPVSGSLLHCLCQLVPHMQVTDWCI